MKKYQFINRNSNGIINVVKSIIRTLIDIVETRISLIITELNEVKSKFLLLIILTGFTIFLVAFGLISLLLILIFTIDPEYRLLIMTGITSILFLSAIILGLWTNHKLKQLKFFYLTCKELKLDRKFLKE
ncbi:MAG: phage holin family protein [Candidatus Dasytiphilus stammeri]